MCLILAHGFVSVKGARFLSRLKSQVSSRVFYELSPPAERFEPGAWPDAQTRPMRMTRPSPETTHGDLLSEAGRNDCADEELPF